MWIRTQDKQRIINSDQIIDIFIGISGTTIIASIFCDADVDGSGITLGKYKDKDTCLEILEHILTVIGTKMPGTTMPLDSDVESWEKDIEGIAKAYIAQDFRGW